MIKRLCEQQAAIAAALLPKRNLTHIEISSEEWRILEDITEVLEPYKDATMYFSADTISVLGPRFSDIQRKVTPVQTDSVAVKQFDLAKDMEKQYLDPEIVALLNKASFLDPYFKTLAHLSTTCQVETVDSVIDELTTSLDMVSVTVSADATEDLVVSPAKK